MNCTHDFASTNAEIEIVRLQGWSAIQRARRGFPRTEQEVTPNNPCGQTLRAGAKRAEETLAAQSPFAGQRSLSGSGL